METELDDSKIFKTRLTEHELSNTRSDKPGKYLLKDKYQRLLLKQAKVIARDLSKKTNINKVYIGGSIVKKKLGKYDKSTGCGIYSDIDIYAILNCRIGDIYPKKLKTLGLTRKKYIWIEKNKIIRFYNVLKADRNGKPLFLLDRFPVGVWLISKYTLKKELKKFPDLFDGAIKFENLI